MPPLDSSERRALLELARHAVTEAVENDHPLEAVPLPGVLSEPAAAFVTLRVAKKLRGCIGRLDPAEPLTQVVADAAQSAALQDPRFKRMQSSELPLLEIEISVLSPFERIDPQQIEIGKHGLMVQRGALRGLLLPQVAVEHHLNREQFLQETCVKAGLPGNAWRDSRTQILGFTAQIFSEGKVDRPTRDNLAF